MASERQAPEPIHFFRRSKRESKCYNQAAHWVVAVRVIGAAMIAILGLKVQQIFSLSVTAALASIIALIVALLVINLVAKWFYFRQFRDLPARPPDNGIRLATVGSPRQLDRWGVLADAHFEPVFFSATLVQPFAGAMTAVAIVLAIPVIAAVAAAMSYIMNEPFGRVLGSGGGGMAFLSGGIVTLWIVGWLWPTYFRIVPGRLDVMRFNNLLNRPVSVERYNLRTAKLLIDLRRGVIFVDESDGRTGEFPIVWMRRSTRERLAYHLLLAAMSSYEAPDLPDDKLLG